MPKFGKKSRENLLTCDKKLQDLFNEVVKHFDCTVTEGYRNEKDQNHAFKMGNSKVLFPNGNHNSLPSFACDVAPYPVDWDDNNRFYYFSGFVKGIATSMGIDIRWGGDWDSDTDLNDQSFNDLVHFELKK